MIGTAGDPDEPGDPRQQCHHGRLDRDGPSGQRDRPGPRRTTASGGTGTPSRTAGSSSPTPASERTHRIDWWAANTDPSLVNFEPDILHSLRRPGSVPRPGQRQHVGRPRLLEGELAPARRLARQGRQPAGAGTAPPANPFTQTVSRPPTFVHGPRPDRTSSTPARAPSARATRSTRTPLSSATGASSTRSARRAHASSSSRATAASATPPTVGARCATRRSRSPTCSGCAAASRARERATHPTARSSRACRRPDDRDSTTVASSRVPAARRLRPRCRSPRRYAGRCPRARRPGQPLPGERRPLPGLRRPADRSDRAAAARPAARGGERRVPAGVALVATEADLTDDPSMLQRPQDYAEYVVAQLGLSRAATRARDHARRIRPGRSRGSCRWTGPPGEST